MPCQIEDTGVDVSNIFPVMIGSNDNGYCLENNDSRVLWFSLSFCPIQSAILTSILMPTCTIFGPEISKQESTPFPRWFFSCINYKCRNEIFTRICINFVNTLSLTFLPNFLIFIFLCCRLMLIYFFFTCYRPCISHAMQEERFALKYWDRSCNVYFFKNCLDLVFSWSLQISGHKFKDISIYFFGYMFFWLERNDKAANFPLIVILFADTCYIREWPHFRMKNNLEMTRLDFGRSLV